MAHSNSPPTGLTWADKQGPTFTSSDLRDDMGVLLATVVNRDPRMERRALGRFLAVVFAERINEWFDTEEDAKAWCVAMVKLS